MRRDPSSLRARSDARRKAEERGEVADSMAARHEILCKIKAGEITLEEGQSQLKKIQKDALKSGKNLRRDF